MTNLNDARVVITGASGGLGSEICKQLLPYHCRMGLVGRNKNKLDSLADELTAQGADVLVIDTDITLEQGRDKVIDSMLEKYQGIDILINNAAIMSFDHFEKQGDTIEKLFATNVFAPMHLCRKVLPLLRKSPQAHIVNIGSTFGSIAFAFFSSYSASKFALRGFSESLRRELADTSIKVSYYAPRAIKTKLNTDKIYEMAEQTKMAMDEPEKIAGEVVKAMVKGKSEIYLGFPEKLFVKLNALFPRIVDMGVAAQTKVMKQICG